MTGHSPEKENPGHHRSYFFSAPIFPPVFVCWRAFPLSTLTFLTPAGMFGAIKLLFYSEAKMNDHPYIPAAAFGLADASAEIIRAKRGMTCACCCCCPSFIKGNRPPMLVIIQI